AALDRGVGDTTGNNLEVWIDRWHGCAPLCARRARLQKLTSGLSNGGRPLLLPRTGQWELFLNLAVETDLQPIIADTDVVDHRKVAIRPTRSPDDRHPIPDPQAILVRWLEQCLFVILLLEHGDVCPALYALPTTAPNAWCWRRARRGRGSVGLRCR